MRKDWEEPEELFWIGKYAADAYKIFVERKWRDVQPNDHALNWWVEWMRGMDAEPRTTKQSLVQVEARADGSARKHPCGERLFNY